jgi:aminoglycoside 6-adenylyltransferase
MTSLLDALPTETEVLARLTAWADATPAIRALLMSSSRARPNGPVDMLSDYDVIVVVTDAERFGQDSAWQDAYGPRLAAWGDQGTQLGMTTYFRGVVYQDFVKIDYSLWPAALLDRISAQGTLPPELDAGYRVLLDKDGQTAGWPAPAYRGYLPVRPSAEEYQALVEEFWWSATYVAKMLWRDELLFARWVLDNDLKLGTLRRLLEWRVALEHGWEVRPGVLGRHLKRRLPPDLWAALEATCVGPEPEANWTALFGTAALFRRVAVEVGAAFGYAYPHALEARMTAFLEAVHRL